MRWDVKQSASISLQHSCRICPTKSTWQGQSRGAKNCSNSQEIARLLWNMKVNCHVYKSPPLLPILRQLNPASNLNFPPLYKPCDFRLFSSIEIFYAFVITSICTTWPDTLILLDLVTEIMFGERYQLWNWSLQSLFNPLSLSPSGLNILLS
jgi:hypothetical protein